MSPIGSGIAAQLGLAEEVYINEVQRIAGTPSAAPTFVFDGAVPGTVPIAATNAQVQAALEALPNIGSGGVVCTGGPLPTAIDITFSGPQVRGRNVPALVVGNGATGLTITTPTPGSGYGDYVAPSRFLEFNDEGIELNVQFLESQGLRAGTRVQRADRVVQFATGVNGAVNLDVLPAGLGLILKHCTGSSVITTPGGATLARDHTYTIADLQGLSLAIQKGVPRQTGGTGNVDAYSYVGCKIAQWSISNGVDELVKLALTIDGKDEDLTRALGVASYPVASQPLSFVGGVLTIDGAATDVRTVSVDVDNSLKLDRRYVRLNTLKKEPLQNALVKIGGSMELDYDGQGRAAYDRFRAGQRSTVRVLWRGPLIEAGFFNELEVTLVSARLTGTTPKNAGPDVVMQSLPYTVDSDGTTSPITVRYRTTDTVD